MKQLPANDSTVGESLTPEQAAARRRFWRDLSEYELGDAAPLATSREFPRSVLLPPEGASRREFLKVMAASLALTGMQGCVRQPAEKIVPYVRMPEQTVPGVAKYYATV